MLQAIFRAGILTQNIIPLTTMFNQCFVMNSNKYPECTYKVDADIRQKNADNTRFFSSDITITSLQVGFDAAHTTGSQLLVFRHQEGPTRPHNTKLVNRNATSSYLLLPGSYLPFAVVSSCIFYMH